MTISMDVLKARLEAYGADFARWPETHEAEEARALIARSAEARRLAVEAAALDRLLADMAVAPAGEALRSAILSETPKTRPGLSEKEAMPRRRSFLRTLWPRGPVWQPAGALAASAILGVFVGLSTVPLLAPQNESEQIDAFTVVLGPVGGMETWYE